MSLKYAALRMLLLCVSVPSIMWSAHILSISSASQTIAIIGQGIQRGETYAEDQIAALVSQRPHSQDQFCDSKRLNGQLFINLKLAELSLNGQNISLLNDRLTEVSRTSHRVIDCSSLNGFAWLALYWSRGNSEGFDEKALNYLMHSYVVAPREGWIAAKRNIFGIRNFDSLPDTHKNDVMLEWQELVRNFAFEAATTSLKEASSILRVQLLARQTEIDDRHWRLFVRHLDRSGYEIPELVINEDRRQLWR